MKSRQNFDARILVCLILAFAGALNGKPVDAPTSATAQASGSAVVPQVGFLEDRPDVKVDKAATTTSSDTGNGILVPIVSVVNPEDSSAKNANPLVALLPAASAGADAKVDSAKLPVVATLPIVPAYDPAEPAPKPEIRRSLDASSSPQKVASNLHKNEEDSSETMDVAEDIVFRPLFRIRQGPGNNVPIYSRNNLQRRRNGSNYRRYNVNGYYRLPYNSLRYNNRADYRSDRSSIEY